MNFSVAVHVHDCGVAHLGALQHLGNERGLPGGVEGADPNADGEGGYAALDEDVGVGAARRRTSRTGAIARGVSRARPMVDHGLGAECFDSVGLVGVGDVQINAGFGVARAAVSSNTLRNWTSSQASLFVAAAAELPVEGDARSGTMFRLRPPSSIQPMLAVVSESMRPRGRRVRISAVTSRADRPFFPGSRPAVGGAAHDLRR